MAIFGRRTARQRLRSAARQALATPSFDAPVDCTPWVIGGLWPAELASITAETTTLAEYLNADLHRIADSANQKLQAIGRAQLAAHARQAAEARVINVARAFAVLRVESTVRQLRNEALNFGTEYAALRAAAQPAVAAAGTRQQTRPAPEPPGVRQQPPASEVFEVIELSRAHNGQPANFAAPHPAEEPPDEAPGEPEPAAPEDRVPAESDEQWLRRMLEFVARQEPGLRWAIGRRADGTAVLATDLAHGWIPPGIDLPAAVQLPEPGRRSGAALVLLGPTVLSATYAPGDRLGWAGGFGPVDCSPQPRALPMAADLGWLLNGATHWRDGLPRLANTLARAGAAGSGVADAEIDLLRVHLDTARYRLLAQYPDLDTPLLLNCLLLAATEAIATGDMVSANYHFAWFQQLNSLSADGGGRSAPMN